LIPSTILFIASPVFDPAFQMRLIDRDVCPDFHRWLQVRRSNQRIDFRRIQRLGFDVPYLKDYIVNLSVFEERSRIWESDKVGNEIYHRTEDEFLVFVKSKPLSNNVSKSEIEKEIEILINLRHPCITAPIGFVFPIESGSQKELNIYSNVFGVLFIIGSDFS
jgi:hypothetical protein